MEFSGFAVLHSPQTEPQSQDTISLKIVQSRCEVINYGAGLADSLKFNCESFQLDTKHLRLNCTGDKLGSPFFLQFYDQVEFMRLFNFLVKRKYLAQQLVFEDLSNRETALVQQASKQINQDQLPNITQVCLLEEPLSPEITNALFTLHLLEVHSHSAHYIQNEGELMVAWFKIRRMLILKLLNQQTIEKYVRLLPRIPALQLIFLFYNTFKRCRVEQVRVEKVGREVLHALFQLLAEGSCTQPNKVLNILGLISQLFEKEAIEQLLKFQRPDQLVAEMLSKNEPWICAQIVEVLATLISYKLKRMPLHCQKPPAIAERELQLCKIVGVPLLNSLCTEDDNVLLQLANLAKDCFDLGSKQINSVVVSQQFLKALAAMKCDSKIKSLAFIKLMRQALTLPACHIQLLQRGLLSKLMHLCSDLRKGLLQNAFYQLVNFLIQAEFRVIIGFIANYAVQQDMGGRSIRRILSKCPGWRATPPPPIKDEAQDFAIVVSVPEALDTDSSLEEIMSLSREVGGTKRDGRELQLNFFEEASQKPPRKLFRC